MSTEDLNPQLSLLQHYRDLFEFAPVAYLVVDRGGVVREANRAAAALLEVEPASMVGRAPESFVVAEDRPTLSDAFSRLLAGHVGRMDDLEVRLEPRPGAVIYSALTLIALLDGEGGVEGVRLVVHDISRSKQMEQVLRETYSKLDLRVRQLGEANAALQAESAAREQARLLAETLRMATLALARDLDLDAVLQSLLEHLRRLVPYDTANVMLLDDESRFVLRAMRGYAAWTDPDRVRETVFDVATTLSVRTVYESGASFLIADTTKFAGWRAVPGSEHVRNWLGVPLMVSSKIAGLCSLDKAEPNFFTEEHVRLAEILATQAAAAIHNARLFEDARKARGQLQTLSLHLVSLQETERQYVAHMLIDSASSALTELADGLGRLAGDAGLAGPTVERVAGLQKMADHAVDGLYRLAADLGMTGIENAGLVPALRQYAESFAVRYGLDVRFEVAGVEEGRLPPDVETSLYRIIQEALTNVARHAHAKHISVSMERRGEWVLAAVEDDGQGFDPQRAVQAGQSGITGMRGRAEIMGGSLTIESEPGAGSTVYVELPYRL